MEPYQQRVVDERKELEDRIVKLEKFINDKRFNELSYAHQRLLSKQKLIMCDYSDILDARIQLFNEESDAGH